PRGCRQVRWQRLDLTHRLLAKTLSPGTPCEGDDRRSALVVGTMGGRPHSAADTRAVPQDRSILSGGYHDASWFRDEQNQADRSTGQSLGRRLVLLHGFCVCTHALSGSRGSVVPHGDWLAARLFWPATTVSLARRRQIMTSAVVGWLAAATSARR